MFQFPGLAPTYLCIQYVVAGYSPARVSPFGHLRIEACVAAPRSLSQLPTSFIASWYQGIHRLLLVTYPHFPKGACFIHESTTLASTCVRTASSLALPYRSTSQPSTRVSNPCLCDSGCYRISRLKLIRFVFR